MAGKEAGSGVSRELGPRGGSGGVGSALGAANTLRTRRARVARGLSAGITVAAALNTRYICTSVPQGRAVGRKGNFWGELAEGPGWGIASCLCAPDPEQVGGSGSLPLAPLH